MWSVLCGETVPLFLARLLFGDSNSACVAPPERAWQHTGTHVRGRALAQERLGKTCSSTTARIAQGLRSTSALRASASGTCSCSEAVCREFCLTVWRHPFLCQVALCEEENYRAVKCYHSTDPRVYKDKYSSKTCCFLADRTIMNY